MQDRTIRLTGAEMSGILTVGGTILGTSRDKPHKMSVGDQTMDMTSVMLETYHKHHLDVLVCLGGGATLLCVAPPPLLYFASLASFSSGRCLD